MLDSLIVAYVKFCDTADRIKTLSTKLYLSDLKTQFVPRRKHSTLVLKTVKLMLYREKIRCLF